MTSLRRHVDATLVGELCWVDPDGTPRAVVATPLWHDDAVWFALAYDALATARAVAAAGRVAVVLTRARDTAEVVLVRGEVSLHPDEAGELFVDRLLAQHLAKHPPSRALADSVMLRREHWWYVPRLLLRVGPDAVTDLPGRGPGEWSLLVGVRPDGSPAVTTDPAGPLPGAADGRGLLLGHERSEDQERESEERVEVAVVAGRAVVAGPAPAPVLPGPPGLLTRWRRQRALQQACVAGLREAGLA